MLRIFVYGTLKPGEENFDRYCAAEVVAIEEAIGLGQLYDLPMGYPAMTSGTAPVHGYVLSFENPAVLQTLDELEEYDPQRSAHLNEYSRLEIEPFSPDGQQLESAWVYQMTSVQAEQLGGVVLPDGKWQAALSSIKLRDRGG